MPSKLNEFVASDMGRPDFVDTGPSNTSVNPALAQLGNAQRVLFLQGPVGPFFDRITRWLLDQGKDVQRVVFQGGDEHDCRLVHPTRFTGAQSAWPAFFSELLKQWEPDCVVLFGQARYYHKVALERARAMDLAVVAMEEGYFRPGFVTMELGGVNGYSTTLDRYVWDEAQAEPGDSFVDIEPNVSPWHFQKMAWHASQHYIALKRERSSFPAYEHHRCDDPNFYARYWVRSWFRKGWHRGRDRDFQRWLFETKQPFFFVPLQLEGDSQIVHHSPFSTNLEFILRVLHSFAAHAPQDSLLVFRQHPHSRGGPGHKEFIRSLAAALSVGHRVHHMTEGDTPDLAEHSLGVVLINSTVGLQALERGVPLIALGDSLYRRPDLTFAGDLDEFWFKRKRPEPELTKAFLAQLKNLTQAPASIYALRSEPLNW